MTVGRESELCSRDRVAMEAPIVFEKEIERIVLLSILNMFSIIGDSVLTKCSFGYVGILTFTTDSCATLAFMNKT